MLAPQDQGPDRRRRRFTAVHRHHLRAHRQVLHRPHSDHHRRLRPRRFGGRPGVQVELPLGGTYWGAADMSGAAHRREGRRFGQAEGQEDRTGHHDSPYGKEPIPLLQERAKMHGFDLSLPGDPPGRGTEGDRLQVRQKPARLRVPVGLGRDELRPIKEAAAVAYPRDKMYGVVVGRRGHPPAGDAAGARGYAHLHGASRHGQGAPGRHQVRAQGQAPVPRPKSAKCFTTAACWRDDERGRRQRAAAQSTARSRSPVSRCRGLENLALDAKALAGGLASRVTPIDQPRASTMKADRWPDPTWDGASGWSRRDTWIRRPTGPQAHDRPRPQKYAAMKEAHSAIALGSPRPTTGTGRGRGPAPSDRP